MLKNKFTIIISVLLALGALAGFIYKREIDHTSQLEAIQKTQAEALDKVNKLRETERLQHDQALKNYEKSLNDVTVRYQKAVKDLEFEKKKRKDEILTNRDPKALAEKLSESFNLKVLP